MSAIPIHNIDGRLCSFEKNIDLSPERVSKILAENSYLSIENKKLEAVVLRLLKVESDIYQALSENGWDRTQKPDPVEYIRTKMKS